MFPVLLPGTVFSNATPPLLWARVVRRVIVQDCMDILRRRGDSFVRTPKKAPVKGLWIHINYSSNGSPESVVVLDSGGKLEIVYVDN